MIKRINAGKNFFFFFFFGLCFWYSPQAAPWRSQTFPPAPPWQSQGSVSGPARWRSTIPGLISCHSPPPEKKPQLLRSSGVVNKKTGARMLAVAEVTVSSFECDLRGPAGCRSELECVGERNCQLKMWSFVNSHVAFVGVCVHVRDDKFPYHRVNLSQA